MTSHISPRPKSIPRWQLHQLARPHKRGGQRQQRTVHRCGAAGLSYSQLSNRLSSAAGEFRATGVEMPAAPLSLCCSLQRATHGANCCRHGVHPLALLGLRHPTAPDLSSTAQSALDTCLDPAKARVLRRTSLPKGAKRLLASVSGEEPRPDPHCEASLRARKADGNAQVATRQRVGQAEARAVNGTAVTSTPVRRAFVHDAMALV